MPASKKFQKSLLSMQGSALFGQALIGIFFPFFVQRSYELTDYETILWFGALHGAMALVIFPLNFYGVKYLGLRRLVQLGIFFQTVFYAILGLGLSDAVSFGVLNLSFVLFICLFWPGFNFLSALATKDGTRGNYFANFQILAVGVNLVAPVLTGFLFEFNQERWSITLAMLFFLISMLLIEKVPKTGAQVGTSRDILTVLKKVFFGPKFPAFFADMALGMTMWICWPLYFKVVVGKFSVMGLITAVMAGLEVFTSKFFGRLSDKISAKKVLVYGVWARCIDLCLRAVYMKFSGLYVVLGIQAVGSVLGPLFQTAAGPRLFEVGEESGYSLLDYILAREIFLGMFRVLWCALAGGVVFYFGTIALGWIFILAGLMAFGFRRL